MYTTIIGNVGDTPELRRLESGVMVTNFSVAQQQRRKTADGYEDEEPLWLRVNAWRGLAENIADTVQKGTRVIVSGKLHSRVWVDDDGDQHTVMELEADEVGVALRFATVPTIVKSTRTGDTAVSTATKALAPLTGGKSTRTATAANIRKVGARR